MHVTLESEAHGTSGHYCTDSVVLSNVVAYQSQVTCTTYSQLASSCLGLRPSSFAAMCGAVLIKARVTFHMHS